MVRLGDPGDAVDKLQAEILDVYAFNKKVVPLLQDPGLGGATFASPVDTCGKVWTGCGQHAGQAQLPNCDQPKE